MDVNELFNHEVWFNIHIGSLDIPITETMIIVWIVSLIVIALAAWLGNTKKWTKVPTSFRQKAAESFYTVFGNILKGTMGEKNYKKFIPYFGTIFMFLIFANTLPLINFIPSAELVEHWTGHLPERWLQLEPPTSDLNIPLTLALMTICLIPLSAIKFKGIKGFLKNFLHPTPIMLPFNILDYVTRTMSLSLRLFGNILAAVIIMDMLYLGALFVKPVVPLASAFFDVFDAGLQAYIFIFLSSVYIAEAINEED